MAVYNPINKILSPIFSSPPLPSGVGATGNIVAFSTPEFSSGTLKMANFLYGNLDSDYPSNSWYRQIQHSATSPQTDIIRVPLQLIISNLAFGTVYNGYTSGVYGSSKIYFSTLETNSANTTAYRFFKYFPVQTGAVASQLGIYETQNHIFSKKQQIKEVRIYTEPIVANNGFTVDLIGSAGTPMTNGSFTFTAGSNVTIGEDLMQYNPTCAPTYALGLRITNTGTTNMAFVKVEIDYQDGGK